MVRVMGNSSERVPVKDLNDCIYYKQIKEYSDSEYEVSADLKKAVASGKAIVLERIASPRGSLDVEGQPTQRPAGTALSVSDLRAVLREMLPKDDGASDSVKEAVREIAPMIVDMVRQEVSRMGLQTIQHQAPLTPEFAGPEYVPTVSTEGMVSNIEAKQTEVSSSEAEDALKALREMQGIK